MKTVASMVFTIVAVVTLGLAGAAFAMPQGPTAHAGFTGLPLRNCEGMYCGKLAELPIGTPVQILLNDNEGWAYVVVPSLNGQQGWVNTNNIF